MLGTWVKKGGEIRRDWNCQDHGRREVAAEEEGGEQDIGIEEAE